MLAGSDLCHFTKVLQSYLPVVAEATYIYINSIGAAKSCRQYESLGANRQVRGINHSTGGILQFNSNHFAERIGEIQRVVVEIHG